MSEMSSQARYGAAITRAAAADPDLAAAFAAAGPPPERSTAAGFPGLLRAIVAQQVSAAAARAIMGRLDALCGDPPDAARFAAADDSALRGAGLSAQKLRYGRALAAAFEDGRLSAQELGLLPDEAAITALTALPGIGRWTAEVYLLFAHDRADIFPAADLALQVAAQRMKGLADRPNERALRQIATAWAPHRGAVARFLWHYYRHPGVG